MQKRCINVRGDQVWYNIYNTCNNSNQGMSSCIVSGKIAIGLHIQPAATPRLFADTPMAVTKLASFSGNQSPASLGGIDKIKTWPKVMSCLYKHHWMDICCHYYLPIAATTWPIESTMNPSGDRPNQRIAAPKAFRDAPIMTPRLSPVPAPLLSSK